MLYTIIDENEVFSLDYAKNFPQITSKKVDKCVLYGVKCKEGFSVCGMFSTNPADYLNPKYRPWGHDPFHLKA